AARRAPSDGGGRGLRGAGGRLLPHRGPRGGAAGARDRKGGLNRSVRRGAALGLRRVNPLRLGAVEISQVGLGRRRVGAGGGGLERSPRVSGAVLGRLRALR